MKQEELPHDLKETEIVALYKKIGNAMECRNYRGIKLLGKVPREVVILTLINFLQWYMGRGRGEDQRKDRSTQ